MCEHPTVYTTAEARLWLRHPENALLALTEYRQLSDSRRHSRRPLLPATMTEGVGVVLDCPQLYGDRPFPRMHFGAFVPNTGRTASSPAVLMIVNDVPGGEAYLLCPLTGPWHAPSDQRPLLVTYAGSSEPRGHHWLTCYQRNLELRIRRATQAYELLTAPQ